jgi:hypothetical protein
MKRPAWTPEQCVAKWGAVVRDLTPEQQLVASWLLEHEARYLNDPLGGLRKSRPLAQYAFPLLRRVVERLCRPSAVDRLAELAEGSPSIQAVLAEELPKVLEEQKWAVGPQIEPLPVDVTELGKRVLASLRSYPFELPSSLRRAL